MNTTFMGGVCSDNCVVLFADRNNYQMGAVKATQDREKVFKLGNQTYMACNGQDGDIEDFSQWSAANLRLYKTRNGYELSPESVHYWIRKNIAEKLRSRDNWSVNSVVGGWNTYTNRPFLGMVDYLGNAIGKQNYVFSGFPGMFTYAIMDGLHKRSMTEAECVDAVKKCIAEVHRRVIISFTNYDVLVIDKDKARRLPPIGAAEIASLSTAFGTTSVLETGSTGFTSLVTAP